jgi:hypothetical protein
MNRKTAGYAACAMVAGLMALTGCATARSPKPNQEGAAAPALMNISQVPGLESMLYVSESASVTRPPQMSSAEDRTNAAMQKQTQGMAPGAVAGGPRDQVVIHIPASAEPEAAAAKPVLKIPALQPEAVMRPPVEEGSWKKPLPPLPSLAGK